MSNTRHCFLLATLSALSLFVAGCSDTTTCTGIVACAPADPGPLIALGTITFTPDFSSRTDSIQFADGPTTDGKVDTSRTIEFSTPNSTLWPSKNPDEMFVAEAGTGQVIKYGLGTNGTVQQTGKIGFGAYSVQTFYWNVIAMASPTKAFLFDEITLQGFTWDPSTMKIISNVDLSSKFNAKEGAKTYRVWREYAVIETDGKYFVSFNYDDPDVLGHLPRSGMIVMDSADDSFTVVEHPTCGGLHNSVLGPDGLIYSASGVFPASVDYIAKTPDASCLVRFDPKTKKWDDTFKFALGTLTGPGDFVGGLFKNAADPNAPVYVRRLQADQAMGLPDALAVLNASIWETWKIDDITNPKVATKTTATLTGASLYPYQIGEKTYVTDLNPTKWSSTLLDVSVDPPAPALEVPGWIIQGVSFH